MKTFYLPKIETRTNVENGIRSYIVKGYATVPNYVYSYKYESDNEGKPVRSFREFFSERAIENIKRKAKNQKIFVDIGHQVGTTLNVDTILKTIQERTDVDISKERDYIINRIKGSDIPMFKVEDLKIDDKGLFVDIRGNPFYRDIDEEHKTYFDAVWNSLDNGFINGMSLNFKPTDFVQVNENLTQIDDADIYGITLDSGVADDMANITEVAMRCVEHTRGEEVWKRKLRRLIM